MAHPLLALAAALATASGCVWYLPALAEVRAGADRPDSLRSSAAACLSGWTTLAGIAVLLLVADPWWLPGAVAGAGAALTAALRTRAAVQRRREIREAVRDRAALEQGPPPAGPEPSRHLFAALVGAGLAASAASAVLLTAAGPGASPGWVTLVVPATTTGLFLTLAIGWAGVVRRAGEGHPRR
ncbi:hypothetical protein [Streptomyces sp. NPDC003247]|uniref:hypothetical protein n=1 Tax=Streptomyces sp. NPDC003247 TaxID=3364677 RepID=UPI00369A1653